MVRAKRAIRTYMRKHKAVIQGELKGEATVAVLCRFFQISAFCWNIQHLGGADFHRKPLIFAETARNRRISQKTNRLSHLVCPF